ncbi:Hypothetical protein NTJ_15475 [Nesidiocoris tenuis]|uniref:Uncharacterized protein n=1 Tax=Nesidiocoris tenuis TaxID=355587 RepID=A0ABN7BE61_9HEMI|nr:Hypothetical protein NTJ_15475 [Nesidiocoris tenuis]
MTIPCSSPPVAVPMSLMENCNIRREIDLHTYDSYQPSHPLDSHPDAMSPEEALWTLIRSVHMKVIGGSSIGLLTVALIIILCLKQ